MANGHDINEELEFEIAWSKLPTDKDREKWTARQAFYSTKKLAEVGRRLTAVEDNCRRAVCDRSSGEAVFTQKMKRVGIPVAGAGVLGTFAYVIIEMTKILHG